MHIEEAWVKATPNCYVMDDRASLAGIRRYYGWRPAKDGERPTDPGNQMALVLEENGVRVRMSLESITTKGVLRKALRNRSLQPMDEQTARWAGVPWTKAQKDKRTLSSEGKE